MKICPFCSSRFRSDSWTCTACGWRAARNGQVHVVMPPHTSARFAPEFFEALDTVEDRHFWFRERNRLIAWALRRHFPGARSLLEVGCGTGQVVASLHRAFPELRLTAAEALVEGLTIAARKAPCAELVQADARELPWEAEFDVVAAFDVLEHVAEDGEAVRQLARAVVPGGGVIVTVPQHRWLWSGVDEYSGHVRRYSRRDLVDTLRGGGLQVERVTSFVCVLLPALAVSRLIRFGNRRVDPLAEYRISSLTNRLGTAASAVDRACIRAGLSLPCGGSLLAVARRAS